MKQSSVFSDKTNFFNLFSDFQNNTTAKDLWSFAVLLFNSALINWALDGLLKPNSNLQSAGVEVPQKKQGVVFSGIQQV
jgi:hypothetical protein